MATTYGPSNIDPSEWTYVGCFYQGTSDEMYDAYAEDMQELWAQLGEPSELTDVVKFHGVDTGNLERPDVRWNRGIGCASCGTHFAHGAVFLRGDDEYIAVGHICGHDLFGQMDIAAAARIKAEKLAATLKLKGIAQKFAEDNDLIVIFKGAAEAKPDDQGIVTSMNQQLVRRGGLSEKQVDFLRTIWDRRNEPDPEPIEEEPKPPVPETTERIQITGKVISHRFQSSDFGDVHKMLIEDDRGFRLWGTVAKGLEGGDTIGWTEEEWPIYSPTLEAGDRVTFMAKVERSRDDESFGFYKRPTKAEVIERAEEMAS